MAVGAPVLIVAENKLGMINHTLLTVEAIRQCGLPIAGIVINQKTNESQPLQQWNIEDVKRWAGIDVPVAVLGPVSSKASMEAEGEALLMALDL